MPSLGSLASGIRPVANSRRGEVYLIELNRDDRPLDPNLRAATSPATVGRRKFQYFPDSLQDSKAINYQPKEVPGGSLPIYQYVNSGERTISFTVVFTTDVDHYTFRGPLTAASQSENLTPELTERVVDAQERLKAVGVADRNVWIPAALQWLRRFMLPRYGEQSEVGVPFVEPPRKLLLVIPGSEIHRNGGGGGFSTSSAIHCIMTQCDITYEALFPTGNPRIATVQLAFAEVAQRGGSIQFPRVTDTDDRNVDDLYTLEPVDRTSFE
jgi:hypothetical protein